METTALKIERLKKGMKQWQLASLVKISQTNLSLYETGKKHCPADLRRRIAEILEIPIDTLFPDERSDLNG